MIIAALIAIQTQTVLSNTLVLIIAVVAIVLVLIDSYAVFRRKVVP